MKKSNKFTRREFIRSGAAMTGGLLISFHVPTSGISAIPENQSAFPMNSLLKIGADDSIHITLCKVEMGQGISTTLSMLIAEELDCDWQKIKVEPPPSGKKEDVAKGIFVLSTGGSDTTRSEFDHCRMAGATAREMLIMAAAKRLGVDPKSCKTKNGLVIAGAAQLRYGEIASDASRLPVPIVKLRQSSEWKLIGKTQRRLDLSDKINGRARYGLDIQFPGLLTAVVARPPAFGGKVKSFDPTAAQAVTGVRHVVQVPSGIAVVADHYWAAKLGREALKVEWDIGPNGIEDSKLLQERYSKLSLGPGMASQQKGDVSASLENAVNKIEAEFILPFLAHAPMEPLNCTVKIFKDKCEIWSATQSPLLHQAEVAAFLGFDLEQIVFHTPYIGGSFGRRGSFGSDWVMEGVHIAKACAESIKLVWSREDDIQGGNYRPAYLHRINIGLDNAHFPVGWQHRIVGQSLFIETPLEKEIIANGIDYSSISGVHGSPYFDSIQNHCIELHTTSSVVPVLAWRSVGHSHTAFVMESLIDELALLGGKDPVDYRRMLLKNHARHLAALNLAAEKSQWDKPLRQGIFRGVAVHAAMGSYVSQVVELSIEKSKIRIHRVVCAIDCGLAVNPDGVKAQMESSIIFGLTAALYGEITLEEGKVKQSNFHDYRMLRINETPAIEVYIVPSTAEMGGAGEPGVPPVAPALANALFAATGKRIRKLPIRPESFFQQ